MALSIFKYFHLLFLVTIIFSCSSKKIITFNRVDDQIPIDKYIGLFNNQYPDSFALTQRIILDVAGKQYDFIGQLTMDRGNAFRAVAFGEMGGQFIDLLAEEDTISILANPTDLPEKPILQGVAEDIKQVFHYNNLKELNFSDSANDTVKISIDTQDDGQLIYLIDNYNNHIFSLKFYSGNKIIRSAEFLEYKKYEGWDREIPSFIKLTNHRWHYSLEMKFSTRYDADKVFKTN